MIFFFTVSTVVCTFVKIYAASSTPVLPVLYFIYKVSQKSSVLYLFFGSCLAVVIFYVVYALRQYSL